MIEFPKDVLIAQPKDEKRIYDLCCIAHAENGFGVMDEATVQASIMKATERRGYIMAFIDGPERVEAVLGLHPQLPWYCKDEPANWYWSDLLFFVHPLHRRSRHALKLFQFARWWQQEMGAPVMLGLMPKDDLEEKEQLFSRLADRRIGSLYLIGGADQWPGPVGTA